MTDYALDSFAVTAYVQGEAGAVRVKELLDEAVSGASRLIMTTVNLGESMYIAYRLSRGRGTG